MSSYSDAFKILCVLSRSLGSLFQKPKTGWNEVLHFREEQEQEKEHKQGEQQREREKQAPR